MKGEQLNLFNQPEKKRMAEIIPFPVDREAAFIRETARVLTIKQGKSAERFWQMTCRRLYARLQVQGIDDTAIQTEIRQFSAAVFSQMQRFAALKAEANNPKGAA